MKIYLKAFLGFVFNFLIAKVMLIYLQLPLWDWQQYLSHQVDHSLGQSHVWELTLVELLGWLITVVVVPIVLAFINIRLLREVLVQIQFKRLKQFFMYLIIEIPFMVIAIENTYLYMAVRIFRQDQDSGLDKLSILLKFICSSIIVLLIFRRILIKRAETVPTT